jgi:hypothetical protein
VDSSSAAERRPIRIYRTFKMDKIPSPLLSSSELDQAIFKITQVLDSMQVRYGIIGSVAVNLYARHYGFPHRSTSEISILVQPTAKLSAMEISAKFTEKRYERNFVCWMINGIRVPQVIVQRQGKYGEEKLIVYFRLLDYYAYPERRRHYDLDLDRANRQHMILRVRGTTVNLLTAPWLLRQKILAWGKRQCAEKRRIDEIDIQALRDIMEIQKKTLTIKDEAEVEALKSFVTSQLDNPADFRSIIYYPELLGPWWEVRRIKVVLFMFSILFLGVSLDLMSSENNDWRTETGPRIQELWQDI